MKTKAPRRLTNIEQKTKCREFITTFEDYDQIPNDRYGRKKYLTKLQQIVDEDSMCLEILMEDLDSFFRKEDEKAMLEGFRKNTSRYIEIFTALAEQLMPKRIKPINPDDEMRHKFQSILKEQRKDNIQQQNQAMFGEHQSVPSAAHRNYDVAIVYGDNSKAKPRAISDLYADQIGSLVVIKAIVVRASQVKPQISVATFACDICGCENYLQVLDNNYRPLDKCMSRKCQQNKVNGKLSFLPGHSKFRPHQQLKIQQTPDQLRDGRIPRTYTLHLKDSNVKGAAPGDIIVVQGIMLPKGKMSFRQQGNLNFQCYVRAVKVIRQKKKYVQMTLTQDMIAQINGIRASLDQQTLFQRLSASIAPQIFGLEHVKKALLLLMAGGVTKQTHDNLRIRGEINIALIGDPGIAKSQLLKHISYLAPRAVYTTGKGSSGVGLTAAIVTDPHSKQLSLQAGALVLADMGICCIDQFDKMDQYDRTAIHEVMEQQTVSIAKAGITTSLNARTSILAAANPLYGRYNKKQTPQKNINLPAALLSRFDLIFILLDQTEQQKDLSLARHIGLVHRHKKGPKGQSFFDPSFLRSYIAYSKMFMPTISQNLHKKLIDMYIQKRQQHNGVVGQGQKYITTRSLLALIRLCQARARLRCSPQVSQYDVNQCMQLLEQAQQNLGIQREERKTKHDYKSRIYELIRDMCKVNQQNRVEYNRLRLKIQAKGYSEDELKDTLDAYIQNNILMRQDDSIFLVSNG